MSIKLELFYFREMLRYGYWRPVYWRQFILNRYFGKTLLNKTPKYSYTATDDFEVHILCCEEDLYSLTWSLRSFLTLSGLKPRIVIYNDGSIKYPIESKFDNLRVVTRKIEGHVMLKKLILPFESEASNIMLLDSDVLFFKKPQEIVDFIHQNKIKSLASMGSDGLCAGLLIMKKEALNRELLMQYLKTADINDYFVEQNGWRFILKDFRPLPATYQIKGPVNDQTVMKHFTSPRRHEMFAWGIDRVKQIMNNLVR